MWNGATQPSGRMLDLLSDVSKLYSYVDNALIPMVNGLKDKVAHGGWEVMNEVCPTSGLITDANSKLKALSH